MHKKNTKSKWGGGEIYNTTAMNIPWNGIVISWWIAGISGEARLCILSKQSRFEKATVEFFFKFIGKKTKSLDRGRPCYTV